MIAAICSDGKLYIALTQVNTDSDVMMLFLDHLSKLLAKENSRFRDNTVFLLDGARYHTSTATRAFY